MKKLLIQLFITTILLNILLASCSTGKKAYERGDYYNATLQAVKRLRSNPESKKALKAIEDSYPMAIEYFQGKIDYTLGSNIEYKYSEIADNYKKMNNLSEEISRCPPALKIFPEINFYVTELTQAQQQAADEQYNAGLNNEKINTRLSWKDAYNNFREADYYVPGYKDVRKRIETAKFNAKLKVIVEPINVPGNYQLSSDFFLTQVIESLENNTPNEFVAYYSPESAQNAGITYPDQILRMNFDEFVIGQMYDKETVREFSRDSVEVGSVTMPDGTSQKVYNTVKAKMTTNRRELISKGVLDVTVIDFPTSKIVSQRKFPGQFVWFTEWAYFNGDERALNLDQIALCKRKPVSPPGNQTLFIEFTKPIFNQVSPFLKSFYSKY